MKRPWAPYLFAALGSVLLSLLAISTNTHINNDGMYYIDAARVANEFGLSSAFQAFNWPFFSWMIAWLAQSGLANYEQSALLLSVVFLALTCMVFVRLYERVSDGRGALWVAALLVLALPGVNVYREDIMRDAGYWLFALLALLYLLNHYESPSWRSAVGWQLCALAGVLFRIDGIALIAFLPFIVFLRDGPFAKRFVAWLQLYSFYLFMALGLLVAYVGGFLDLLDGPSTKASAIAHYTDPLNLWRGLEHANNKLGELFFYDGQNRERFYASMMTVTGITIVVYVLIKAAGFFGVPYTMAFVYGGARRELLNSGFTKPLYGIATALLFFFVLLVVLRPFLVGRYTAIVAFVALLLLTPAVEKLWQRLRTSVGGKRLGWVLVIVLTVSTLDAVIAMPDRSKDYLVDVGQWVQTNVPPGQAVYSNSLKALYFSDRRFLRQYQVARDDMMEWLTQSHDKTDTWAIVYLRRGESEALRQTVAELNAGGLIEQRASFEGSKGDAAVVYRLNADGR